MPSVYTLIARGMFCGAKYTHHTFTPIIKHLITTTANKHPGKKSFTDKNMKNPTSTKLCISQNKIATSRGPPLKSYCPNKSNYKNPNTSGTHAADTVHTFQPLRSGSSKVMSAELIDADTNQHRKLLASTRDRDQRPGPFPLTAPMFTIILAIDQVHVTLVHRALIA